MHTTVESPLETTRSIQDRIGSGELLGPRFLANGPLVDGDPPAWPEALVARNETEGRSVVDRLAAGGADFIKVYDSLSREAFLAIGHGPQRARRGACLDHGARPRNVDSERPDAPRSRRPNFGGH
jgi:hypothetical protein